MRNRFIDIVPDVAVRSASNGKHIYPDVWMVTPMIKLIADYMAEELLPDIANTIYIMWTIFTVIAFLVLFYAIISYIIFEIKNHRKGK